MVWPGVRIKAYENDRQFHAQAKTVEEATEAARKVYEESKKQTNTRRNPSLSKEGKEVKSKVLCTSTWMMNYMKKFCLKKKGLGLTCSAEYLGDDVRVTDWKKKRKGKSRRRRRSKEWK